MEKDDGTWVVNKLVPNFKMLGKKLGKDMPKVKNAIMSLDNAKVEAFIASGTMEVEGYSLNKDEVRVRWSSFPVLLRTSSLLFLEQ